MTSTSDPKRRFATDVVRTLRDAGYQAYWAGGCVRDQEMGHAPTDYDVATSAHPEQVIDVFGKHRSIAIGASFGVTPVLGPRAAGQIEIATFREDAPYSDGRRPDAVHFSSAERDAERRDFTINGMFYDPLEERLIDYVGGRDDLNLRLIRAIGDPHARLLEDRLRMLRGVRFASRFQFVLEDATKAAIARHAPEIVSISAERITAETRKMLTDSGRSQALRLLLETRLLEALLPAVKTLVADEGERERFLQLQDLLEEPDFALAWAALLYPLGLTPAEVNRVCRDWMLTNHERQEAVWLVQHEASLRRADREPWPTIQRLLITPYSRSGCQLALAVARSRGESTRGVEFAIDRLAWPADRLNPPPLLNGNDVLKLGVPAGPEIKRLLDATRDLQLLGELSDSAGAEQWVRRQIER